MNDKEILGKRISEVRKSRGLKQTDLATKLRCSRQYISVIESGKHKTSRKTLHKIANILDCDENYLFDPSIKIPNMEEHILGMIHMAALANGYTDSIDNNTLFFDKNNKQIAINKDFLAKFCFTFTKSFEDCLNGFGEVKEK